MRRMRSDLLLAGGTFVTLAACDFDASPELHSTADLEPAERPALVVQIMVDQMRPDYIDRFTQIWQRDVPGKVQGLQLIKAEGTWFEDAETASAPTVTAAGHASVCAGASPSAHGIVSNTMYSAELEAFEFSAEDSSLELVRTRGILRDDPLSLAPVNASGPAKALTLAFADTLKQRTSGKSKTIAISVKDRGAVFCGGRQSDGTYWYDGKSGSMVSSTAFTRQLPEWVDEFNRRRPADIERNWTPLHPLIVYQSALMDPYYRRALAVRSPLAETYGLGFPVLMSRDDVSRTEALETYKRTPMSSEHIADFAIAALREEKLGQGEETDFLHVSFSAPDYTGHFYGPESYEMMDTYVRLNRTIGRLMTAAISAVGKGQVLFVLTADHGVQNMPEVKLAAGRDAGRLDHVKVNETIKKALEEAFGDGEWLIGFENDQVYFNENDFAEAEIPLNRAEKVVREILSTIKGVDRVYNRKEILSAESDETAIIKRGFHPERSGHLYVVVRKGWLSSKLLAGNHGTVYMEDRKIPMAFMGWKIPPGQTIRGVVRADDIAPTLLDLLGYEIGDHMTGRSLKDKIISRY